MGFHRFLIIFTVAEITRIIVKLSTLSDSITFSHFYGLQNQSFSPHGRACLTTIWNRVQNSRCRGAACCPPGEHYSPAQRRTFTWRSNAGFFFFYLWRWEEHDVNLGPRDMLSFGSQAFLYSFTLYCTVTVLFGWSLVALDWWRRPAMFSCFVWWQRYEGPQQSGLCGYASQRDGDDDCDDSELSRLVSVVHMPALATSGACRWATTVPLSFFSLPLLFFSRIEVG